MSGWLAEVLLGGVFASALFDVPGFLLEYVKPDWMHTVCLWFLQYLEGCVTWELCTTVGGTSTEFGILIRYLVAETCAHAAWNPSHELRVGQREPGHRVDTTVSSTVELQKGAAAFPPAA